MKSVAFRPIKEDSVTSVLFYLRAQIVREGQDGLAHVDALLRLRGVDPDAQTVPRKRPYYFARGKLRVAIIAALREGPMTGEDIARRVQGNGMDHAKAYRLVYRCLMHMKDKGMVWRSGGTWRTTLSQPHA